LLKTSVFLRQNVGYLHRFSDKAITGMVNFNPFGRRNAEAEHQAREAGRLPPGQKLTQGWPVLTYGSVPKVDLGTWMFRIIGLVESEVTFGWDQFMALPQTTVHCDIHCVTTWSRLDNDFTGVLVSDVLSHARLKAEALFVMVHSYGGYTTDLSVADLIGPDCILAHSHDGKSLAPEHGGPLRLVVPKLYLWKSAKWVRGFEFMASDRAGFWETYGYNMHGDPWKEERYS
jgi:DMSO/TMAO reductase YedYZ molybdopterin-dependent catalytic subunit